MIKTVLGTEIGANTHSLHVSDMIKCGKGGCTVEGVHTRRDLRGWWNGLSDVWEEDVLV